MKDLCKEGAVSLGNGDWGKKRGLKGGWKMKKERHHTLICNYSDWGKREEGVE